MKKKKQPILYYQVIKTSTDPRDYDEGVLYEGYDLEEARKTLHSAKSACRDKSYKHELRECYLPKPADFMSEEALNDALSTYSLLKE